MKNSEPDIEDAANLPCLRNSWEVIHGDESMPICLQGQSSKWYKVFTLADLQNVFKMIGNSNYLLSAGNTAKGMYEQNI